PERVWSVMTRIVLTTQHADPAFTPLALLYLKAQLVASGHDPQKIDIAEFDRSATPDAIADRLLTFDPDVVGLSCYVWNVRTLMDAGPLLKTRRPSLRAVAGGPEVGPIAESVITRYADVDVVVQSEGERPFTALVDAWRGGRDIGAIPGITFRDGARVVDT